MLQLFMRLSIFLFFSFFPSSIFLISFTTVSRSFIEKIIYMCMKHVMLSLYMRLVKSRVVFIVWFASSCEKFLLFANLFINFISHERSVFDSILFSYLDFGEDLYIFYFCVELLSGEFRLNFYDFKWIEIESFEKIYFHIIFFFLSF